MSLQTSLLDSQSTHQTLLHQLNLMDDMIISLISSCKREIDISKSSLEPTRARVWDIINEIWLNDQSSGDVVSYD